MKRKILLLIVAAVIISGGIFAGYRGNLSKPYEKIGYALDTQIRIIVYDKNVDKNAVNEAYNEILRLDRLFSNFNIESETAKLNKLKKLTVSGELKKVIEEGVRVSEITDGNYDITVFPLSEIWNYKKATVPDINSIKSARDKVDYKNVKINGNEITLINDAEIDVSSIAKGYIADCIIDYLKSRKIKSALVDAGGNIKVLGSPDGKKEYFKIGIRDPDMTKSVPMGNIKIKNKSIVTSGIYERNFTYNNKLYHHIIDIKTGYPAESDVLSASVISESSMQADAYATSIVAMGSEKGLELIEKTSGFECIIVTKDNHIILSEGMQDFELTNNEYKI